MEQSIFQTVEKVRNLTLQTLEKMPEDIADIVPDGYNNNIRWNFGHIAVVHEKLTIGALGEKINIPESFINYFAPGTKPADWKNPPPSLKEIASVLKEQNSRIKQILSGRLEEKLPVPFTTSSGMKFSTAVETLTFSLFHEGMHLETVKRIYRNLKGKKS